MQLIPAIDLRNGRCVRLFQGEFDAETQYDVTPLGLYEKYATMGAQWLHVVDLDGARDGSAGNREIIETLTEPRAMSVQVGGGIRNEAVLRSLLGSGVSRAVIGSVAVTTPAMVRDWFDEFGTERIVLAFDTRLDDDGTPRVTTHGWKEQSTTTLWEALDQFQGRAKHVLCTDVARDGALTGPNVDLYRDAVRRFPNIEWQASGGIRSAEDLTALAQTGVAGAISGRALLENRIDRKELLPFLPSASFPA